MDAIKSLFADSFQGFLPSDIPFFLLQLFTSAIVTITLLYIYKFKHRNTSQFEITVLPLSLLVVLLVTLCKNIPLFGLVIIALSILLNPFKNENDKTKITYLFLCLGFSAAIGTGHILFSLLTFSVIIIFLLLVKK